MAYHDLALALAGERIPNAAGHPVTPFLGALLRAVNNFGPNCEAAARLAVPEAQNVLLRLALRLSHPAAEEPNNR